MELAPHFWVALGEIILVNIILSGDNAVVIALASRNLPPQHRNRAVILGSAGAIALRIVFCFFVATLMAVPYLKLVGSALLLWIGVKLMVPEHGDEKGGKDEKRHRPPAPAAPRRQYRKQQGNEDEGPARTIDQHRLRS